MLISSHFFGLRPENGELTGEIRPSSSLRDPKRLSMPHTKQNNLLHSQGLMQLLHQHYQVDKVVHFKKSKVT